MPNIVHIMKEWEYTFGSVSKEAWIKQIESDLKQKPLHSTYSEWWQGASLIPFVHGDDLDGEIVRLPDSLFSQAPQIAEWIDAGSLSSDEVNQQILDSLQFGAQSIILKYDDIIQDHLNKWLKGVYHEMISVAVQVASLQTLHSIPEISRIPLHIRIERNDPSPSLSLLIDDTNKLTQEMASIRFLYRFPSTGTWDLYTVDTFKKLLADLDTWRSYGLSPSSFFKQCILALEADESYFKHILQARVLHLLWQNIQAMVLAEAQEHTKTYLECHIIPMSQELPEQYLIRASMSGLAASLCGTTTLCIHHSTLSTIPSFYKRIHRNIHHLLELESGMYKGTDPLAGAYAFDLNCKQLTEKLWSLLF